MKKVNMKVLTNLLNSYKDGYIDATEFKCILVDLGMMVQPTIIKTTSINTEQLKNMGDNVIVIIKGS